VIEIRRLAKGDAKVLDSVADEVFDNPVDPRLAAEFLGDSRHHLIVALDGALVVGMITAVDYVHPDKEAQLWINEVGVAAEYRKRGIGRMLLDSMLAHGRALGCTEAWLGTEPDNAAANALYESARGDPETFTLYSWKHADGGHQH
jgi:aminoglycoside 6'-N-acetyltransferase I